MAVPLAASGHAASKGILRDKDYETPKRAGRFDLQQVMS